MTSTPDYGNNFHLNPTMRHFLNKLRRKYLTRKNSYYRRAITAFATSVEIVLIYMIVVLSYAGLLYCMKFFWFFFSHTMVGQTFMQEFPDRTGIFVAIINSDILSLTLKLTTAAFGICLLISACCQLFHITSFFYTARGLVHKIFFWGLPLTALVALSLPPDFAIYSWKTAFSLSLLPTFGIFTACFRYTTKLLPELYITLTLPDEERPPKKTRQLILLSFIYGLAASSLFRLVIHPFWTDMNLFEPIGSLLISKNANEYLITGAFALWYNLPFWSMAWLCGLIIGLMVFPPWFHAALSLAAGLFLPYLLAGNDHSLDYGSNIHWLVHALLNGLAFPSLLAGAWLGRKNRNHWVVFSRYAHENGISDYS